METHICYTCGKEKDIELFSIDNKTGNYSSWCKECKSTYLKAYRKANKEHIAKYQHEYNMTVRKTRHNTEGVKYKYPNTKRNKEKQRVAEKKWKESNPDHKMACNIRSRIWDVLKGYKKYNRFNELVGCDLGSLKLHIESLFVDGMTWENHTTDGWHLDHIIPCKAFDFSIPIHQRACFNWRNLQPMWGKPNIAKGCVYLQEDFDAYMRDFIENAW